MSEHYYQISDVYPMLKNPSKFKGKRPITARSSWETKFILQYIDVNVNIFEWYSEDLVIPYICGTDGKQHRYFMDFVLRAKDKNGDITTILVEVKPHAQTVEPAKPKRMTKGAIKQLHTWVKNSSKWKATNMLVEERKRKGENISFMIVTEKDAPFFLK